MMTGACNLCGGLSQTEGMLVIEGAIDKPIFRFHQGCVIKLFHTVLLCVNFIT